MSNLPLLSPGLALVDQSGGATSQFMQFWQQFGQAITGAISDAGTAGQQAGTASDSATAALTAANAAVASVASKLDETTADSRYVRQLQTPTWTAPSGTASRTSLSAYSSPGAASSYTQAQVDALMTAVQALSQAVVALIADLQANDTLA